MSRKDFVKKFEKHGIKVEKSEVYTSAFATAYYLKHIVKFNKKVYMIGGKGLSEELNEVGIPNIGLGVCVQMYIEQILYYLEIYVTV
jgi:4-nitrophenyl phosphatase